MSEISTSYFLGIAEVATEFLGPRHIVSRLCQKARRSGDPASVDRALVAVRKLSPMQRDQILGTAKRRQQEEETPH